MKRRLKMLFLILLGNAMLAFSVCAFVVPQNFMLGGVTGIGLIVQEFLPVRLSVVAAVANVALFLLGWVFLGKKFAMTSLLSTLLYPLIMMVFEAMPLATLFVGDKLIFAIFCGVLSGLGIGFVIRSGGSTGGMDIPPCILQKYFGIPVGTSLMVFDTLTVLILVCFRGLDDLLYSILIIALMSLTINRAVMMGEQKIEIIIISPAYEQIRHEILETINCGVTMLNIETGYEAEAQKAILSVVYAKKYPQIRDAALRIDSKAFIVANQVMNVNGRGYTLARHENID